MKTELKTSNDQGKVLVIIGPTGSGKTGLAIDVALELAKRRGILAPDVAAEVISADSRAIYKGMDIGTAKPTVDEMRGVPHWGIDLVGPGERFTVADFKAYAEQKISEIVQRGHLPIIAGGTGLYVDALIFNYSFSENAKNSYADREQMSDRFMVVGIDWPREQLRERLRLRAEQFFDQPIVEEYKKVAAMYDADCQAMKSNIYPIIRDMVDGIITREEAIELFVLDDWHLAKRQLTWFKRNPNIKWLPLAEARDYILSNL
jgi:tRNA dimethylallyltransferase